MMKILIGGAPNKLYLESKFVNRHGLIAGATGTGKTVTLQGLAESFSEIGVPVFLADVKGDLSGLATGGKTHPKIDERVQTIGMDNFTFKGFPVCFWDVFGKMGIPIRATVSDMGPQLLSRILGLNEVQEGILTLAFEFADSEGMLILDLKDLKTTLEHLMDHGSEIGAQYGRISKASVAAILRRLLILKREGGNGFFGETALDYQDLMQQTYDGKGTINILSAKNLIGKPKIYATFLLWLLSELFESLPEVGDQELPRFVFFFDEAHLLFKDAPKVFLDKIEQVVRLIRSKGVGVFFVTQSPSDIPENILGQLGNRVQHALRAFTPKDQKAVRVAAQTFRQNPKLDTKKVITQLGVGEALVSVLQKKGSPSIVERTLIRPPYSKMGPLAPGERKKITERHPLFSKYKTAIDSHSAHEALLARAKQIAKEAEKNPPPAKRVSKGRTRQSAGEAFVKSMARSIGSSIGRKLLRGILGSFFKGK